jgi:hypothetical protein
VKAVARKIEGPEAKGLNGAFEVEYTLGVRMVLGGAPFAMADMTHLEWGGSQPYRVKCASEVRGVADIEIVCQDFGTPEPEDLLEAVDAAITAAFKGRPVFAGCMGGIGRTGVFMATVLKVLDPQQVFGSASFRLSWQPQVQMARQLYLSHTVETDQQEKLVDMIDVSKIRRKLKWLWAMAVVRQTLFGR